MAKHNVDLSKLSAAQLEQLVVDATIEKKSKEEEARSESLKKLKESGVLKEMKDSLKGIKSKIKTLGKGKVSFEITLPIVFTMESELDDDDLRYYNGFYHTLRATLGKDHNLTPKQAKLLKSVVEDYAESACEDIQKLAPDAVMEPFEILKNEISELQKLIHKHKLDIEDLE